MPEPAAFDAECRRKGNDWLSANPGKVDAAPSLWSPFRNHLEDGFGRLCGYAAMLCPTGGTVDHYISAKNDSSKLYEWDNYRFASGTMNGIKRNKDEKVLDPYDVPNGWFEIILPSLQMKLTKAVPPENRAQALYMLEEMKLGDDERIVRWRQSWFEAYERGGLTLHELRRFAPLIAEAVDRRIAAGAPR